MSVPFKHLLAFVTTDRRHLLIIQPSLNQPTHCLVKVIVKP